MAKLSGLTSKLVSGAVLATMTLGYFSILLVAGLSLSNYRDKNALESHSIIENPQKRDTGLITGITSITSGPTQQEPNKETEIYQKEPKQVR